MTETIVPKVVRGRVELIVSYQDKSITHVFPAEGQNTYRNVGSQILAKKLAVPTGDYTASLVHTAFCDSRVENEPEFGNVKDMVKNRWLWVFNRHLWTSNGVYTFQDSEAKGTSEELNVAQLEEMLKDGKEVKGLRFSKDGKVRFAPKGSYVLGQHTTQSLAKDGFVITSYGERGAEQLGEVAEKIRKTPWTYGLEINERQAPKQSVSALGANYGGSWLGVNGGDCDDSSGGCAFGVSATGEANAQKI